MCHLFPSSLYKWIFLAYSQSQFPYNFSKDWLWLTILQNLPLILHDLSALVYQLKAHSELAIPWISWLWVRGHPCSRLWAVNIVSQGDLSVSSHWWMQSVMGSLMDKGPRKIDHCWGGHPKTHLLLCNVSLYLYKLALTNFNMSLTTKSSFAITNFKMMVSISAKFLSFSHH